jgi:predicted O-methyltransferase YrrM
MPVLQRAIMQKLYGGDIWQDFMPKLIDREVNIQGWNGEHPSLQRLASVAGVKIAIDVGVWKGQSTINMALAMKNAGIDGCVLAVDTFLGSPEHWQLGSDFFTRSCGLPDLYQTFLSNVHRAHVTEYIVPMPQTSVGAANILQRLQVEASLVHIDAAHEYEEVLRDAKEYWQLLTPGGFLIGDDYDETWPGVVHAAAEFSMTVRRPLMIERPKWIMQKPPLPASP